MKKIQGRFAPTPSGRMHLGNLFAALLAWLDVRSADGILTLRIEDLDPVRCSVEKAACLIDDLKWLGLDWDEGGLEDVWCQSRRTSYYECAFQMLAQKGLVYPCYCTRAERLASSAPHRDDGTVVYDRRCAALTRDQQRELEKMGRRPAWRVRVPEEQITIEDGHYGSYIEHLGRECGDFMIRRSDDIYAYQLAVVVDDGMMGVNHVVRGRDLLPSAPRQSWLHRQLGYEPPCFFHTPLLLAADGRRLAKRDHALDMEALRKRYRPEDLIGILGWWAGLLNKPEPVTAAQLVNDFSWDKVPKEDIKVILP